MSDNSEQKETTQNPNIPEIFLKPYSPSEHESKIYAEWESSGFFNPDVCIEKGLTKPDAEAFAIVMPPPNANGNLHAGHGLVFTIQDIMMRYNRMRGKRALWLPGADHAGFETQVVYEKKLEKEGRSRFSMDPKDLYNEIMNFTMSSKSFMENQIRQLGASCDWSRSLFTLDDSVIKIVYDTFKRLETDELLYRGARIVNWCSKHQTSLSNLETSHVERQDKFYYFKYGPFTIGTARPETKFGDKYVVMHPDDARYAEYSHGQKIELEWINGPITATVIKDEAGDPEMGSGAMTITPWHSGIDFEIARRHNLDYEQIIDWRGKLLPIAGEFTGMSIKDAREKIVEKLKEKGLLVKIDEAYTHSVPCCYKCDREIEPQIREQWFIKTKLLAKKALKAADAEEVVFTTDRDERVFRDWMDKIEDWNISRQIVWGIPIPAKICTVCNHGMVDIKNIITECSQCSGAVIQDPDTFDTWFSSGQWPLATTGYPDSDDFKNYYPTSIMETGKDIIFFWVSRMIMLGIYCTGKVPFKKVYLHGMVRDKHGKKMSKSKGNVISPGEIQEKYGTDALRMGLMVNNAPGTDMNLDPDKVNAYKKFANKIWNISRFVLESVSDYTGDEVIIASEADSSDIAIISRLNEISLEITDHMEKDRFDLAAEKIYHYVWHEFADKIIEESKPLIAGNDAHVRKLRQQTLLTGLLTSLKLLHPFMPFVTETIWQNLPKNVLGKEREMLMVTKWPI
ncbi:MAG: valine--tRNA ligase [Candidatus Pacebacteria bacterium]|nr:valine--tRNA ligase [Candidatus Paceibacterota bacterium]MCF7857586.1 valine--tRNA ligase [Candidatus Paceibacterota bacterium]